MGNVACAVILSDEQEAKIMGKMIQWETELAQALKRATAENRPVLLDFHNPH